MKPKLSHILCIDDEPDILQVATMCLEMVGGFKVTPCNGSAEGVQKAKEVKPDLILLDVMMPEMDGPQTLKKLRENVDLNHVPIIFMTASVQPEEVSRYLALGAVDVIKKPFDPMALHTQVLHIWDKHTSAHREKE